MKRTPLLNRHLSALIARLGHLDQVVVADAGLPAPPGVPVIDLAISANLPTFFQLLDALKTEMVVEQALYATEAGADWVTDLRDTLARWEADQGKPIAVQTTSHSAFKEQTQAAQAIIRTGDFTPYANVILVSGVVF